ncbi:MAG: patatin-like phospholipase family protein, partial [Lysobacterales bacterium]
AAADLQIEDLPKPFAAIATDLENGREVWFQEGNLAEAVRASMALPGLFPAVRHSNRWLVDGGLVNPVPVTFCRAMGADVVIAINLNSDVIRSRAQIKPEPEPETEKKKGVLQNLKKTTIEYSSAIFPDNGKKNDAPGLFAAITNSINIVQDRITRSRLAGDPAEVVISPRLAHIGMLDFQRAGEAIAEGEHCIQNAIEEIKKATQQN